MRKARQTARRRRLGFAAAAASAAALAALPGAARAEDVNITASTNTGVNLDTFTGSTVRVFPGVTVSNTGTLIGNSFPGIFASTQAWTLTIDGTVNAPIGNSVRFQAGGTVNNFGTITTGLSMGIELTGAGGTVFNAAGALIDTGSNGVFIDNGAGMVTNAGTIRSSIEAVSLRAGGTVTNQAGGLIEAIDTFNAVAVLGGTTRTVINDGIIRNLSAVGLFPAGISIAGGTVTNNAGGQIFGTYNAIWGNGGVALTVNNAGLLQANDSANGGAAIEADAGGTINNSGRITNTGDGILFIGAGTVTNTGTIESTAGGRAIVFSGSAPHALVLGTGSVLTGNVQGGTGADALVLQGTGSETISKFLSFQTLSMQGTSWTLNGAGTFSAGSAVQSGILKISGTLTSPTVSIQSAGTLAGTGTVVGDVVNAGTLAPGASIGTLAITGSVTFNAGATYEVEVDASGAGDRTNATGTATINGGTVRVLANLGTYAPSTTYTILTANGGRTGTFDGVTSNFAFLQPELAYDATNVFLTLKLVALDFSGVAETRNQDAAGRVAGALGPGNAVWDALVLADAATARGALDLLSGEIHASLKTALFEDSQHVRDALLARVRLAFAEGDDTPSMLVAQAPGAPPVSPAWAPPRRFGVWAQGYGALGRTVRDENAGTLTRSVRGVFAGADLPLGEHGMLGIAAGYGRSSLDVDARASSATVDSYHLAVYGGARIGPFGLRAGIAHAWHDMDTRRGIAFPGFADSASASYGARTLQIFGEAGHAFTLRGAAFEPYANLSYVRVSTDGFRENGGAAALSGEGRAKSLVFSTLGVRAAALVTLAEGRALTLRGGVGWRHAFGAVTPEAGLAFNAAAASPFAAAGVPVARDSFALDAGAAVALGSRVRMGFAYAGQLAPRAHSHRLSLQATLRF